MFEELSLNILDIAMNSLTAGARMIRITVAESERLDSLTIEITDDGRGMDSQTLKQVLGKNLSTKKGRKKPIGLGLAMLRQTSEMCGGVFTARSEPRRCTAITASMQLSHVDRPPVGDLPGTILTLCADPSVDVQLDYRTDQGVFHFRSPEKSLTKE